MPRHQYIHSTLDQPYFHAVGKEGTSKSAELYQRLIWAVFWVVIHFNLTVEREDTVTDLEIN